MVKKKKKGKATKKVKMSSEKDILTAKVRELEQELQIRKEVLRQQTEDLELWRGRRTAEMKRKMACVSHLERVLERETEQCIHMQEQLQLEKDLRVLIERRALGEFADADRNREVMRTLFLQQKLELEGKLSLLEELRLTRNSQRANLKRLEEALEAKNIALHAKTKVEDVNHVNHLLNNREEFLRLLESVKQECKAVFELRLPAYAKNRLEESIRLRGQCEDASLAVLEAQEYSRTFKKLTKALEFEQETQTYSETRAKSLDWLYGRKLQFLRREAIDLEEEETKYPVEQRCAIKDSEVAVSRVRAEFEAVEHILWNQGEHRAFLLEQIEKRRERNGFLISVVIRAANVFHGKMSKVIVADESCMGYEVLQQIRMILEIPLRDIL